MYKIVFFGTPDYVVPILKALHKKFVTGPGISPIVAVVTQPPKPVGRKQVMTYSPVDKWAHERGIETFYSSSDLLDTNLDFDIGVLASYGEIITKDVIDLFPQGILVIHPSLLPEYRGASPIQAAIADGKSETGLSVIKMDEKMDHGPIVSQFKEEILPNDTFEELRQRIFEKSADFVADLIPVYIKQKVKPKEQDHTKATYTKMITKEDGYVDLEKDAPEVIERKLRAYSPWPGIWTNVRLTTDKEQETRRLKILEVDIDKSLARSRLSLVTVQLEGKNPVSWKQFQSAYLR